VICNKTTLRSSGNFLTIAMKTLTLLLLAVTSALVTARAQDSKTTAPATTPVVAPATSPATQPAVKPEPAAVAPSSVTASTTTAPVSAKASEPKSGSDRDSQNRGPKGGPTTPGSKSSSTKSGSTVPAEGFAAFKPISDKNIFNPNRNGRAQSDQPARKSPKVESFALVGTMSYEKGEFAFFESENSSYRKTAKPGDDIAGHKLTTIGSDEVKLLKDEKEVELKVGYQLRREDEGAWLASLRPLPEEPYRSPTSSSSPSSFGSSFGGGSGGGNSELIRRMIEASMQGGGGGSRFGSDRDRGGSSSSSRFGSDRGSSDRDRFGSQNSRGSSGDRDRGGSGGSSSSSGSQSPSPAAPASTTPPANESEILKRLMERRQQENKQ